MSHDFQLIRFEKYSPDTPRESKEGKSFTKEKIFFSQCKYIHFAEVNL